MNIFDTFVVPRGADGERGADLMEKTGSALRELATAALDVRDAAHVLEIGFGPGMGLEALLALVPRGQVTGLDPSLLMHRRARSRNDDAVRNGRLELVVGEANQMPFATGRFNAVLAIDNVHFWADRPAALQQIRRVIDGAPASLVLALSPQSGGSARAVTRDLARASFEVDYQNESLNGFLIRATAT
ncbi:class I SAM-dependent methyltransferase [Plantibacter sp. MCCC 1A11337]|uniref:class I SAM-dependent methyltransferase n=1 Tax=Plantibacter sp. MCCC 1A11337 TaxID=2736644 RepID=UPI001581CCDF|nr:class I SAM-dependent methyltransferase [Plantibacter sp. MCCC 1A11337]NUJ89138.1 class I SAM-dependent methyltransferase [Plantibacter sp. MCCC 1A11337]